MDKPKYKWSSGSVTATVWINTTKKTVNGKEIEVEWPSVQIVRNYKDKKDEWQSTSNFRLIDIPDVMTVARHAFDELRVRQPLLDASITSNAEEGNKLDDMAALKDMLERYNLTAVPKQ